MDMLKDNKDGRAERNMAIAKKDMLDRIQKLEAKSKLTSGMQAELESLKIIIEKFETLEKKIFEEVPGDGLPSDWIKKLLS